MNLRTSLGTAGWPPLDRDFQRQKALYPHRCERMPQDDDTIRQFGTHLRPDGVFGSHRGSISAMPWLTHLSLWRRFGMSVARQMHYCDISSDRYLRQLASA